MNATKVIGKGTRRELLNVERKTREEAAARLAAEKKAQAEDVAKYEAYEHVVLQRRIQARAARIYDMELASVQAADVGVALTEAQLERRDRVPSRVVQQQGGPMSLPANEQGALVPEPLPRHDARHEKNALRVAAMTVSIRQLDELASTDDPDAVMDAVVARWALIE